MTKGHRCCVINCKAASHNSDGSKNENAGRFFSIPSVKKHLGDEVKELSSSRRLAWISAIRRLGITFEKKNLAYKVCSRHFHKGVPAYERLRNDPDWAPSLYLGHNEIHKTDVLRHERHEKRMKTVNLNMNASKKVDLPLKMDALCQTDLTTCEINNMEEKIQELTKEANKKKLDTDFFKNDDNKVKYFTGLPSFFTFMHLFNFLKPFLLSSKRVLSPFDTLLVVFLRIRLNLPVQYIAYFYGIHRSTVASTFQETLSIMYTRLSPMIKWPSRECLQESMPHEFVEAFGSNVAVIIDCFEVYIETPSNILARAQTFSNYKHHHTMKYLIGVTPQGVISFISKGWGGRASDKYITENSGFLNNLQPHDIVLADRGFDIQESVSLMGAEVKLPAFTRGKCQMEALKVEETRKLAHLRIHVERLIGLVVGKFTILSDTVPLNLVLHCDKENCTLLDKIVTIACVMANLCPSIVHNVQK